MPKEVTKTEKYVEPDPIVSPVEEIEEYDSIAYIKSVGAERIYVYRIDPMTGTRHHVTRVNPEALTWELMENIDGGRGREYIIYAYSKGKYKKAVTIHMDSGVDSGGDSNTFSSVDSNILNVSNQGVNILAEALKEANKQTIEMMKPLLQNKPDTTNMMADMVKMIGVVIQAPLQVMMGSMAEMMKLNMENQTPRGMLETVKDLLEVSRELMPEKGEWNMQEELLKKVFDMFFTMQTAQGIKPSLKTTPGGGIGGLSPPLPPTPPDIRTSANSSPAPKAETQSSLDVNFSGKVDLNTFITGYTQLMMLFMDVDPYLMAEAFIEKCPKEFWKELNDLMSQPDAFMKIKTICPYIEQNEEWFKNWVVEVQKSLLEPDTNEEREDESS